MKRRSFLKSASAVSIPFMLGGVQVAAIPRSPFMTAASGNDKVLVLVRLDGGNDGLNTLIPLDQYDKLYNLRQNVIVPESSILEIGNNLGFHPSMPGFRNLYNDGKLNIIQDVAYPNQNRSHFRSTDIWTSGSEAEVFETTGWVGRYFESLHPDFPDAYPNDDCPDPFAITMGTFVSQTCQGTAANFSTALVDPTSLSNIVTGDPGDIDLNSYYGMQLDFLRTALIQSNAYAESISNAATMGTNMATYPDSNPLAQQLKIVAQMISGGLGTSVYIVSQGEYDTHANQVDSSGTTTGVHANLLETLSEAISSFQQDIDLLGLSERVIGMTFSEFGRRIRSNDSYGTDHGTAAPMFVFGSCINPTILGNNFEIPDEVDVQDGIPMQYDFRSVYGSVLMDWFEVSDEEVRNLLFEDFQHIPIIQACNSTSVQDLPEALQIPAYNFPNPFESWTTIVFESLGDKIKISIFDMLGIKIKEVSNQFFTKGEHRIKVDMSPFSVGNYSLRISTKTRQRTMIITKT